MMYSVFFRLMLRLFSFFFLFFFIVFHFVLGYIYQSDVGFIKSDNFLLLYKRQGDEKENLYINGKRLDIVSNQLLLYNINKGCYKISYGKNEDVVCMYKKKFINLPIVYVKNIIPFTGNKINVCDILDANKNYFGKIRKIKCKKFVFVKSDNKIFVCNSEGQYCHFLTSFNGYILGYNDKGLVVLSGNRFYNFVFN